MTEAPLVYGCPNPEWKGDGFCDDGNNNAVCNYDGGDCCGDNVNMNYCSECQCLDPGYTHHPTEVTVVCENPQYIGDGYCDDHLNIHDCTYDGGDCCGTAVQTMYCSDCECLDVNYFWPTTASPTTESPCQDSWIGDGHCDDDNNNAVCNYDGGDCCGDNVNMNYCSVCQCLDPWYVQITDAPATTCQDSWQGDGYCDDVNNNAECNYDGGDCCGDNVILTYCSICQCLDPAYVSGHYVNFHVITATDNTGIGNTLVTCTTSGGGVWTGYTDSSGFVHLGPFSYGELVTVEIFRYGYDTLVQQFVCSSSMDFVMLGMNPTVSKKIIF